MEHWDAEFYVKVNDDVYVNIGMRSFIYQMLKILVSASSSMLLTIPYRGLICMSILTPVPVQISYFGFRF